MSIQETIASQTGISRYPLKIANGLQLYAQKAKRIFSHGDLKVFYPYRNLLGTHPFFLRYYKNPPLPYSNKVSANVFHWVNSIPEGWRNSTYVIEPNDHPLAVTGLTEPVDVLKNIDKAIEHYSSEKCKKILIEGEGQLALFERFFPKNILEKTEILRLGAVVQHVNFGNRLVDCKAPIFLCLASDYKRKGVDILIDSWCNSRAKNRSKLILACPNIPPEQQNKLKNENIEIIRKAPLSKEEKFRLNKIADIVIAPLHVDGGANIIEAFEFGLPVITMRSQRSFIRNGNGWVVDVPFYFYDEGYGKEWKTWEHFWRILENAKKNHNFDITVQGLVRIFDKIADNPEILLAMGKVSYDLAINEFSLEKRNESLRRIYKNALD